MLQQLGELWQRFLEQPPARQVLLVAMPTLAAALIVLGGLLVWSASGSFVRPEPTVVVRAEGSPAPPTNQVVVITTPTTSPVPLPTVVVPARDAAPSPSPSPVAAATSTPSPPPALSARVVNTEGEGANMRRAPSVSAQRVKLLAEGAVVELIGGEQRGDGYTWRQVRDADGTLGYVIADFLLPLQAPPGATPILPPPTIRVEEITSPVARGAEATLTIVTRPGVRCEVRVLLYGPATVPREGLESKTADADGVCSWTWRVPEDVVPGTWRYRISAGEGEGRATREVPLVVS